MRLAFLLAALVLTLLGACSGRRLPPGTPPPEYEPPLVTPWPPESDAGADASTANAREGADAASQPTGEPALSLDAGPR